MNTLRWPLVDHLTLLVVLAFEKVDPKRLSETTGAVNGFTVLYLPPAGIIVVRAITHHYRV